MWEHIDALDLEALAAARLQAHLASQAAAAVGATLATPEADWSHTALSWSGRDRALVGPEVGGRRAGLAIGTLELLVIGESTARFPLAGRTLEEGTAWLAEAFGAGLKRPEHDLPSHPVASGAAFEAVAGLGALERWFGNAARVLERAVRGESAASPVRLWPHHFDIASLITLDDTGDAETSTSVGLGLSPGDGSYDEPYLYVSPWPYPEPRRADLPLGNGHWHTDGFYAAVLTATGLGTAEGQALRAEDFLQQATGACRHMLGLAARPAAPPARKWFKLAEPDTLPEGRVTSVNAGLETLCLTHHEGCFAALTNACPHQGGPLGEGSIEKGWLRCPWHGWDYNPLTGQSPGAYGDGLDTFPVEVRADGVWAAVEVDAPHEPTASDEMVQTMVNWGVRWVFGMVGHSNLGLADGVRRAVESGDLHYVGIRHEGAAAFAVSAYGKLTGRPAACLAIAGPGATNLLTGLWDANVDRAPALALTGQVQTQFLGRGAFQEVDLKAAFGGVAQFTATTLHDSRFGELMSLACKNALLHRGVSHLIFPDEVQELPARGKPGTPDGRMGDLAIRPSEASLDAAVTRLQAAKRPVIIVGHGARFAMDEVTAFAEALNIPVLTTFKGKGLISDHHPLGCGVLGRSGTPIASWFMNESDLLVVLGSSFSNHTGITSYKPILQVDFEPGALGRRHPVEVPVLGDIGQTVRALRDRLGGHTFEDPRTEVAERWRIWREEKASRTRDDRGEGVNAATIFESLSRTCPEDAVIAVDVGNNTYSFGRYFEARNQAVLMSGYLGSIGFGLPAAMGAWAATQEDGPWKGRKVVSVSGDGGLGQYLAELTTLVKYGMDITHVVLVNGELGKISKEQRAGHWPVWETSLRNPSFAAFAESCGALAIRVDAADALDAALTRAIEHSGPALVEIESDALLL